jgi:hypothetical protein
MSQKEVLLLASNKFLNVDDELDSSSHCFSLLILYFSRFRQTESRFSKTGESGEKRFFCCFVLHPVIFFWLKDLK